MPLVMTVTVMLMLLSTIVYKVERDTDYSYSSP
jgi:hypothetical protein